MNKGTRSVRSAPFRGLDAVSALSLLLLLLAGLPAVLIVEPLGAFGTPANLVALMCFAAWVAMRLTPAVGAPQSAQPIKVGLAFFALAVVISYAHAMQRALTWQELNGADRGLLITAAWCGIALLTADGVCCSSRLRTLLRRLVLAAAVIAGVGLLQFTIGLDLNRYMHVPGLVVNSEGSFIQSRGLRRVAGTATHPIEFGVVLATALPLAVHLATYETDRARLRRWVPVVLIAVGLLLSISRSAIICVAIAAIIVLPTWPRSRRRCALLVALVFLLVMRAAVPGLLGTIKNLFLLFNQDTSTQARVDDWAVASRLIGESPIVGIGWGTYLPTIYNRVLDNQYLGVMIETGLLGLLALLALLLIALFTARGARRRSADPADRDLAQSLAASLSAHTVAFATFDSLSFPIFAAVLFLLIGCSGALWRFQVAPPSALHCHLRGHCLSRPPDSGRRAAPRPRTSESVPTRAELLT